MVEAPRPRLQQPRSTPVLPDALVPVIATELDETGEYRAVLDASALQQLVDLRWAALRAGRLLGRRVKVSTTQAVTPGDAPVLARVTFTSGHGSAIPLQRLPG
ncbi:hypothetical protein ACVW00_003963 [Marmoricola sp. URHA0025 HA25]